jgi:large subunit ribosomal protein L2
MQKRIRQQRRGKGSSTYRAPSFRYKGKAGYNKLTEETVKGKILDIIKCQGHSAPLIQVEYDNKEKVLMVAPEGIRVGGSIESGGKSKSIAGNVTALENIPEGTAVYNIENNPGDGGKFVRSSGTSAKIVGKTKAGVAIKLPSNKQKLFNPKCRATIGVIAGSGRLDKPFLKAGKRYYAKKAKNKLYPKVCGVSMNAVSHPFGSGSSHTKGRPTQASRHAPPGRKVGSIAPKRTGKKR